MIPFDEVVRMVRMELSFSCRSGQADLTWAEPNRAEQRCHSHAVFDSISIEHNRTVAFNRTDT